MTSVREDNAASTATDTRQRLLDVAIALIGRHGFAGTSLQMIADEFGFTKAAIYYHFRTRDQLLLALMEPILDQNLRAVEWAEGQRTPRTQMDAMVQGYARVVARNRSLAAVMVFDSSVRHVLQNHPVWDDLIGRQLAILMQSEPNADGFIKVTALFSGLAGAATATPPDLDEDMVIERLSAIGRRILGLKQPRPARATEGVGQRRPEPAPARWKQLLTEA